MDGVINELLVVVRQGIMALVSQGHVFEDHGVGRVSEIYVI